MANRPIDFSLADFTYNDNPDVTHAPQEFMEWAANDEIQWGLSFFEQTLGGSASPRVSVTNPRTGVKREMINLTSYNYLGLNKHPEVIQAVIEGVQKYGLGASGSPRLSGFMEVHEELSEKLCKLKGKEDCILFSAGVMGNIGGLQAFLGKGDVLVMDSLGHQSMIDGATLAKCKLRLFEHNNLEDTDAQLKIGKEKGQRQLIAIEGVYSMDGDLCDLPGIVEVAERYGAGIWIDEAHSTLMFGEKGGGVAEHFGLEDRVGMSFGTFSKSFGGVGGFICAPKDLMLYIRCYSTPYMFSCAPAPPVICGLLKSLEVATRDNTLRHKLWANTKYFRDRLVGMNLNLGNSASQVLPIIVGYQREHLYKTTEAMQKRGLFIQPVDYPAVPADQTRFRVSMSAEYTQPDMDEALNIIEDVLVKGKLD